MRLGINGRFLAARMTGVQRVARELCIELLQHREATVFVPAHTHTSLPREVQVVHGKLSGHAFEQLELPRLVRASGIDLLLNPANSAPRRVSEQAMVVHDVLPLTHPHWFTRRYAMWQRRVVRPVIRRARYIFTFTEWSARQIGRACGVPLDRIHVITQGTAPLTTPSDSKVVDATLIQLGIQQPYFLFVGAGDVRKNLSLMVEVMAGLRRGQRTPPLLVAVGQRNRRIQPAMRNETATAPGILFVPQASDDELRALYTGATALCFPSLAEGFGRPPLEALACGTPALVGDYGAARELLGGAVPILPYEPEPWRQRLRALLEEPAEREHLLRHSKAFLTRFTWSRAAEQLLAVLALETHSRAGQTSAPGAVASAAAVRTSGNGSAAGSPVS